MGLHFRPIKRADPRSLPWGWHPGGRRLAAGTGPAFRRARLGPEGAVGRSSGGKEQWWEGPARGLALHAALRAGPPRPPGGSAAQAERSGQKPAAGRAPGGHGRLVSRPLIHARLAFLLFSEAVRRAGSRFLGYHCVGRLTV